jgi:hypothetical protein
MQQALLPQEIQARVAAVFHIAGGIALPAGAFIAVSLANVFGIAHTLWIAVGGALASVLFLGFSKLWTFHELPATALAR